MKELLAAMNRRTFLAAACAAPALAALRAQSPAVESGFVPLFDGQSLAGWSVQEGPPSAFRVADGAIVVDQGSNFPAWLRSDRQYENFADRIQGDKDSFPGKSLIPDRVQSCRGTES